MFHVYMAYKNLLQTVEGIRPIFHSQASLPTCWDELKLIVHSRFLQADSSRFGKASKHYFT